jgi:galactoside O-acetyltransferase
MGIRKTYWQLRALLADLADCTRVSAIREAIRDSARKARTTRLAKQGRGISIARDAEIINPERLRLGSEVIVQSRVLLHCGGLEWSRGHGEICIGARTYIGHSCVLYGAGGIEVGNDVLLGPNVVITSQGHSFSDGRVPISKQPLVLARIVIEDNVWVGASATITPGVRIGRGSVIAAGALVCKDVPPGSLVAGVPAKILRSLPTLSAE